MRRGIIGRIMYNWITTDNGLGWKSTWPGSYGVCFKTSSKYSFYPQENNHLIDDRDDSLEMLLELNQMDRWERDRLSGICSNLFVKHTQINSNKTYHNSDCRNINCHAKYEYFHGFWSGSEAEYSKRRQYVSPFCTTWFLYFSNV